jgi:3-mercaptopyruvate sulfurtransferase SseA
MAKNQTVKYLPFVLMGLGLILIGGVVFLTSAGSPDSTEQKSGSSNGSFLSDQNIPRINLGDAKVAYDQGAAVFLDVRGEMSFNEGHIPFAVSIPEDKLPDNLRKIDTSEWIITYCT